MSPEFEINNKLVPFMIDKKKSQNINANCWNLYFFIIYLLLNKGNKKSQI
jgi:hypothetical protein